MNTRLVLLGLLLALPVASGLPAQQRVDVALSVNNARGDAVPGARVRATAPGLDTTVRVNDRGRITLALPSGNVHFAVSSLGYEPLQQDVTVSSTRNSAEFVLVALVQQLGAREIRERWIGVRGIIGDNATRQPVANAEVMVAQFKRVVRTDSAGRFEIPLPKATEVVLQIARAGYETLVTGFRLNEDEGTNVVFFLTPGSDPNGQKNRLRDLQQRMAVTPLRSFVASRAELEKRGATTVYDALIASGLLMKAGLTIGSEVCLLVDGLPRYGFPPTTVQLDDIDFIEVFGFASDIGNSLRQAWGKGRCATMPNASGPMTRRNVEFISVWRRK